MHDITQLWGMFIIGKEEEEEEEASQVKANQNLT